MSKDPKKPVIGDLSIDASALAEVIVDLPPGKRLGLRSTQPGFAEAVAEIRANQPGFGSLAGLRDDVVATLDGDIALRDEIDAFLPAALKLAELLEETRAVIDDRLQRQVFIIAQAVESRAKLLRDDELLARYARTSAYRSAIGNKAARTRARNLGELGEDAPADAVEPFEPTPETPESAPPPPAAG
ncbi:hypothetical protein [Haliangium ochraceum]|uniref:Uncharacterized protein n=1 Tax=Haliangium ochraceum (strain DSM 14365 / JCM 11303 / SMP-2) TaxID=502025 RepID=D0LM18_HALO1|nr:hypothetical protein [Haliangium ochraceum]ACY15196.1 hypothetical protein Hoch_2665 [Haliangium ochraceum DSM 14365]